MRFTKRAEENQPSSDPESRVVRLFPATQTRRLDPGAALARVIEGEIIPRLLLAHETGERSTFGGGAELGYADVHAFAEAAVDEDVETLEQRVDVLLARGVALEDVWFGLMAPAARLMGVWWEDDVCTFTEVTIGLGRLQQVVHAMSQRTVAPEPRPDRRVLFSVTPGEQHTFGVLLLTETFRRAGWRTTATSEPSIRDLVEMVSNETFDILGLSLTDERWIGALADTIQATREASRNPNLRVLVGGGVFTRRPELAFTMGADATAADPSACVRAAESLILQSVRFS